MQRSRGFVLVVVGLLVFSATMVVSAATAPSRDVSAAGPSVPDTDLAPTDSATASSPSDGSATDTATNDAESTTATPTQSNRVLIGIQGGCAQWKCNGQVALLSNTRGIEEREIQWRVSDADSYFDVTRLANGTVVAGFHHNDYEEDCGPYESPCTKTGIRLIDPTGEGEPTTRTIFSMPVRTAFSSEIHDVEPLGDGQFLFTDMEYERVAIVEDGAIAWQWNASQFYDAPDDPTRVDWLHINDVDVINESHYLVSVRNANQVLVIERGAGVVEVINADRGGHDEACTEHAGIADHDGDGDVTCGNPEIIDEQHNPQWLPNGAVLIADSENDRVVELHRTEDGVWEPVWALYEANGLPFNWPRDADRLPNGNTLITDSLQKRVLEVEPDGDVVWSHGTDLIPYEADPSPAGEYPGQNFGAVTATPERTVTDSQSDATTATQSDATTATQSDETTATPGALRTVDAAQAGGVEERDTTVPVLSLLLVGMKSVAPWLPIWFTEAQIGATLLSVGLVAAGGIDSYRRD